VVTSADAKEWARTSLRGNCSSLYTPFAGTDGDEIDYEAIRALVRYLLVDLGQDGLWLAGGIGEFWSLTTDEQKEVVRVAIEEARAVKPEALIQVLSSTDNAKVTVELTRHAQALGADVCYVMTPYFECAGKAGVYEFLRYVTDRTDGPIGLFNSSATGLVLTPQECVDLYRAFPAVCGLKNGVFDPQHSLAIHRLEPEMVVWEALDEAGIRLGIPHPGALGSALYLYEVPGKLLFREHLDLLLEGDYERADKFAAESGLAGIRAATKRFQEHPSRPGMFTHWGAGFKFGASVLGLPVGAYPHSRPPQTAFPDSLKGPVRDAFLAAGFIDAAS
jgi:4-hydroxy-tetrahydrodipicolinate synthase